jgi:hypothetical protein
VWVALLGYVPFSLTCIAFLGSRRGLVVAMVLGWAFLPQFDPFGKMVPLLHSKAMWVSASLLAASLVMDLRRWVGVRMTWLDLPVAALPVLSLVASVANGKGIYEGASAGFETALAWGVPYALGRVYLGGPRGVADLASGWILGAMAYVPLVAWEMRMSPQLHRQIYGFHQHEFQQHMRFGGFRPLLFMQHGLMVGIFLACAAILAWWLWRTGARRRILGLPVGAVAATLVAFTIASKTVGAVVLLGVGVLALEAARYLRAPMVLVLLLAVAPVYCASRLSGWDAASAVRFANQAINAERANSLHDRLFNERLLVSKALQKPWMGWSRSETQLVDPDGRTVTVTDSLWIIALSSLGLLGLASVLLALALPVAALVHRFPGRAWGARRFAPAAALAAVLVVALLDALVNDMRLPMFMAAAGALTSLSRAAARERGRARGPRAQVRPSPPPMRRAA